jgi:hypothetical protein
MMLTLFPALRSLVLCAALGLLAGCTSVPLDNSGDMRATYQLGEFRMLLNGTAPQAALATQQAFKQLALFEVKNDVRTYEADLAARTRDDNFVRVALREVNSRQTLIAIRVDKTGDKVLSREIFEYVEANMSGGAAR